METERQIVSEPLKMLPLLRSIAREARERRCAILELEQRLTAFTRVPRRRGKEISDLEARLANQHLALRLAAKELVRLGWTFDAFDPSCLRFQQEQGHESVSIRLDQTGFHPARRPA